MGHAKFLLDIEREGNPMTYNDFFTNKVSHPSSTFFFFFFIFWAFPITDLEG